MRSIAERKSSLKFVTEATVRFRGSLRQVVVECDPHGFTATVRLAGTRTKLPFTWEGVYVHAAKQAAEKVRSEKAALRKATKGVKR